MFWQIDSLEFLTSRIFFFFRIFKKNKFILFIYFWLRWVFVAVCRLSLVVVSRGYPSLWCTGFSCCGARALGTEASVVVACRLSGCGSRSLERRLSSCGARA